MSEQNDIERIEVGLYLREMNESATHHFQQRIRKYKQYISSKIYQPIVDAIGDEGWGISFIQFMMNENYFLCDIYVNKEEHFNIITSICYGYLDNEFKLDYYLRGDFQQYIFFLAR